MKQIILILAIIGIVIACSKKDLDNNSTITNIVIPTQLGMNVLQTQKLDVNVFPSNTNPNIEFVWSSSEPDIATVDSIGNVSASSIGNTVITVALKEDPAISAKCNIIVSDDIAEITDPNFLAWVLDFDTNNDGLIQKSEAAKVKELLIMQRKIKSLAGIECFINLELLDCSHNELTKLDLSKNTVLREVYCAGNKIDSIDISGSESLERLNCSNNRISSIDVTHNPKLRYFACSMNNGSMSKDNYGIQEIDVTQNPELEILEAHYLHISSIDVTQNPKLKKLDIGLSCYTLEDKFKPIEEIDLSNNPELEDLNCMGGNRTGVGLISLDLSHNPKLVTLNTYGNPRLAKLDLTKNVNLTSLICSHNGLQELDLTQCIKIESVTCEWNQLKNIDLRKCSELKYLNCANNMIEELDFSNTQLGYLLAQNNRITKINMGSKTFTTPNSSIGGNDPRPYLYMKLNDNLISNIDLSKQTYLSWIEINNNKLEHLDVSACKQLGGLYCDNNQLVDLNITGLKEIYELRCRNNKLHGTLNVSALSVSRMFTEGNQLKHIKVAKEFKPNATYFFEGKSFPCFTKDPFTEWIFK